MLRTLLVIRSLYTENYTNAHTHTRTRTHTHTHTLCIQASKDVHTLNVVTHWDRSSSFKVWSSFFCFVLISSAALLCGPGGDTRSERTPDTGTGGSRSPTHMPFHMPSHSYGKPAAWTDLNHMRVISTEEKLMTWYKYTRTHAHTQHTHQHWGAHTPTNATRTAECFLCTYVCTVYTNVLSTITGDNCMTCITSDMNVHAMHGMPSVPGQAGAHTPNAQCHVCTCMCVYTHTHNFDPNHKMQSLPDRSMPTPSIEQAALKAQCW